MNGSVSQLKIGPKTNINDSPRRAHPIQKLFPAVVLMADLIKPFVITIKACDSKSAKKRSPTDCVMARALKRLGADGAVVSKSYTYVVVGDLVIRSFTRPSVARELTSFDRNAGFDNGTYALSAISPRHRLGNGPKRQWGPARKKRGAEFRHIAIHQTKNMRGAVR